MKIGYRRVSTLDQNLDRQDIGSLDKVFEEHVSGATAKDRPALQDMIEFARDGDEVVVWSIDRLARDLRDLQAIIQSLIDKGVSVTFLSEKLTFSPSSDDPFSNLQLHLMGAHGRKTGDPLTVESSARSIGSQTRAQSSTRPHHLGRRRNPKRSDRAAFQIRRRRDIPRRSISTLARLATD